MHAKNGWFSTKVLVKIKWTWKADRWPSKRSGKLYESFWMKIYENIQKWNPETRCFLLDDFSIRDVQESFSKVLFCQVVISKIFMFSPKIGEDEPILTISMFHIAKRSSDRWFLEDSLDMRHETWRRELRQLCWNRSWERSRSLWKMPTDTLKEDLAKVDPEKELNHLPTLSFKGMC